jgi:thiol-disulfide isomerase/thioredoxin
LLVLVALVGAAAGYYSFRSANMASKSRGIAPSATASEASGTRDATATGTPAAATSASSPATGGSAPSEDEAPPSTPVPAEVPEVSIPDMAGKLHKLRDAGGHERLFNFWATWCEPCRREIPLLNGLQQQYSAEGLQVVGIAIDDRGAVQQFLKSTPMHYQLLVGEEGGFEAAQKFGMALALPFSVFADATNRIIAVKLGELHGDEAAAIFANMRALRAGTTTFEAAQQNIAEALRSLATQRSKQKAAE